MATSQVFWTLLGEDRAWLTHTRMSGLHRVEAEVGRKWVYLRFANKKNRRRIPLTVWEATPHVPDVGQTIADVANALRGYSKGE